MAPGRHRLIDELPVPPSVALVTAAAARERDDDLEPLISALAARDVDAVAVDWDDPAVDWAAYGLAVVRSTWDYPERLDAFLAWVAHVDGATTLLNPAAVLRWNTDKRYLRVLDRMGIPIVPTTFCEPGAAAPDLPGEGPWVVKPAVSAGARDTSRHIDAESAGKHAARLSETGRAAMVQPYVPAIDADGETAVVYVDGEFSHGLRKAAILAETVEMVGGLYAAESMSSRDPSHAEHAAAGAALAAAREALKLDRPFLYARVDLVPGEQGEPLLMELELTEPSLFHAHGPGSADRFADAIVRRLPES